MTELESRTMAMAAALLLAVSVVRWATSGPTRPVELPADTAVLPDLLEDSRRRLDEAEERSRPLAEGEIVDPNRAGEVQLDRLPGVGPGVARRIMAARDSGGPFVRPGDLARVRGIGPATVEKLTPYLDLHDPPGRRVTPAARTGRPPPGHRLTDPGSGLQGARGTPLVDLNSADARTLQSLPGVGPALAERILALRREVGRFGSIEELLRVRGIGTATLARIRTRVRPLR